MMITSCHIYSHILHIYGVLDSLIAELVLGLEHSDEFYNLDQWLTSSPIEQCLLPVSAMSSCILVLILTMGY